MIPSITGIAARVIDSIFGANISIVGEIETHLGLEQLSIGMAEEKFVEDNPDYLKGRQFISLT